MSEPWVFTIATNKVRDFWRSGRHRQSQRESNLDAEQVAERFAGQPRAEAYTKDENDYENLCARGDLDLV